MDSQDYLNQISAEVRPEKPQGKLMSIISSIYFKIGVITVAALVVIMIIGGILSGGKGSQKDDCINLKLQLDNTITIINEYQPSLKSSDLRSLSASLKGVLGSTTSQLNNYMINTYSFEEKDIKEAVLEEADLNRDAILQELYDARVNGYLDHTYARRITTEIADIMNNSADIVNSSSDEVLSSLLTTSYDSLNNLYTQFNDFSETK